MPPIGKKKKTKVVTTNAGRDMYMIEYSAPKRKNQDKLKDDILAEANKKSRLMKKNKFYKKVSMHIKYESGKYISTNFVDTGKILEIFQPYDEQDYDDFGRIVEFGYKFY